MQNDNTLIQQLKSKDERALSILYDKYSGAIYGVIIKMIRDEGKAQNILQDTFMTVWDKAENYDANKGRFYTWVYRIAKNKTLNVLRKSDPFIQTDDFSVYTNKKEDISIDSEYLELNGAVKQLEDHHKEAIELVYFKGLTHREAHIEMDVPLGTFKSYVRQALKQVREIYSRTLSLIILILNAL
ncbi:sigma-70 family RNA polymerase sigma factor [Winogradskyella echinorum]|uniref:Sigma-70 family RNA polymerase sigma factor n=1 Tax=Winogradskyella echinorum TaxID=538189 RepID=A0ABR6XWL2_9FLAO|nr:sigma-70 family RNA polymerase sigma factor [Winogradskyella echinorum]MBC3844882.1 sigma-70 family RNA polymerase sigma factor [Winogradskyella echinorum]MBC5749230.1 sigma-70 family RNA polymerase sigma factor [Winogradskyella echinorum]